MPPKPTKAAPDADAPLQRYRARRDFARTPEPGGAVRGTRRDADAPLSFVVQKHWASRLHYDFRLEWGGVMLSWAVPKGPSLDPRVKSLAIRVEDHPLDYNRFEGTIPKGQYGAGAVIVWDRGRWEPLGDADAGLAQGKLAFRLYGEKLGGLWELVRTSRPDDTKRNQWLLLKKRGDAWARPAQEYDVISALPDSVIAHPLAPEAALPARLAPQLATAVASAPAGGPWIVETKFDGYRLLARIAGGRCRLFTRNGHDWTERLAELAAEVDALGIDSAWLDGEIVVIGGDGVPDFNRLQNAIDASRSAEIRYFVFDLPYAAGRDLRALPLAARRAELEALFAGRAGEHVRLSETFDATPAQMLEAARRMGLEGVMLKRADAPYVSARSETWLKLKCRQRQEFVIVGFTARANTPGEVGSLHLGYHDGGVLRSAGSVGTGWSAAEGRAMHKRLSKLVIEQPAVDAASIAPGRWARRTLADEHWVAPRAVVEVEFADWTPDGHVRHAVWRGWRSDKPASTIVREALAAIVGPAPAPPSAAARITHPERVVDAESGLRKIDVVHYYESIAPWLLPQLRERPVSLLRAPQGIAGELFFQKHAETRMPGLRELDAALWPGHEPLLVVDDGAALLAAAQMNTIEFHTWNATASHIEQPDRVVFDLDPGEGVPWAQVREGAQLMRTLLDELGLRSWLKTSGGKGLHLAVPIAPRLKADAVKDFAAAAVRHMARTLPQRFVAKAGPANRVGRIFIDYLRNGHGQTTVAAYSARARPGLPVSMPIEWEQLDELRSAAQWNMANAREAVSLRRQDPWRDFGARPQDLGAAIERLLRPSYR